MAEPTGRARPESRRRTPTRELSGHVGKLAERVRTLSERARLSESTAEQLAAVQTRSAQLRALAERAEALAATARIIGVAPALPKASLEDARRSVRELRAKYQADPLSVRLPQPRTIEAPFPATTTALRDAWSKTTAAPAQALALRDLLGRIPSAFGRARNDIENLCAQLAEAAVSLPSTPEQVAAVHELQRRLRERIDGLTSDGLDQSVRDFLSSASTTGVSLDSLLAQSEVLDFLRSNGLLPSLRVHFRRPGER